MKFTAQQARGNKVVHVALEIIYDKIKAASRTRDGMTIRFDHMFPIPGPDTLNDIEDTLRDDGYTAYWEYDSSGVAEMMIKWG